LDYNSGSRSSKRNLKLTIVCAYFSTAKTSDSIISDAQLDLSVVDDRLLETVSWRKALPKGLKLFSNFLNEDQHDRLLSELSYLLPFRQESSADKSLLQSVRHHSRLIKNIYGEKHLKNLMPNTLEVMSSLLFDNRKEAHAYCLFEKKPNAVQINAYESNDGCPLHTDANTIGKVIAMLSFGTPCVMNLVPKENIENRNMLPIENDKLAIRLLLEAKSLLLLSSEVRYKWEHGILPASDHLFKGSTIHRGQRYSLVFWRVPDTQTDLSNDECFSSLHKKSKLLRYAKNQGRLKEISSSFYWN